MDQCSPKDNGNIGVKMRSIDDFFENQELVVKNQWLLAALTALATLDRPAPTKANGCREVNVF